MSQLPAPNLSLLWPPGAATTAHSTKPWNVSAARDLDLETLVSALDGGLGARQTIREALLALIEDPQVILYRQEILQDLLDRQGLASRLEAALPRLRTIQEHWTIDTELWGIREVAVRLGELSTYVESVGLLHAAFEGEDELRSNGLQRLKVQLQQISQDETYQQLRRELPELLSQVQSVASITIGVNLDAQMRPEQATLLAINKQRFTSASVLNRIMGRTDEWEGIASLHAPYQGGAVSTASQAQSLTPLMSPLLNDLAELTNKISRPIVVALKRYTGLHSAFLANLANELPFYLGASKLIHRIQEAGLPMCRPELAPMEERLAQADEAYNLCLAVRVLGNPSQADLRASVITNPIRLDPHARVAILTGPNLGGKTTYTQTVGLIHTMAQAGLYVPAANARLSPVDGIYTHFPVEERPEAGAGRLGEESGRLQSIFALLTRYSLLLMNESLSSTSAGESLYLARDIVRILQQLEVRAIFSTHLHELAAEVDQLNLQAPPGGQAASLVASPLDVPDSPEDIEADLAEVRAPLTRSYKIQPGPPMGHSFARQVAARHGISYPQLEDLFKKRGLL